MKILWVTNVALPSIAAHCHISSITGGGWLEGISEVLIAENTHELIVCFPLAGKLEEGKIGQIIYYSFQTQGLYKYSMNTEERLVSIIKKERPALIHIFGTEFPHSLAAVSAAEQCNMLDHTIISIQGLVSVYAKHFYADLPVKAIHGYTLRDFIKHDNIFWQRKKYEKRGKFEISALKKVKHVIGRTDWDHACVHIINDDANYHFCNETLRSTFYSGKWDYKHCEKHSIFLGSSSYSIKGFHCVLAVTPQILEIFPDAKIYVTGESPLNKSGIKSTLHRTYYQTYIEKMLKKYRIEGNVIFLGKLSADEMKLRMLKSNVYILPSSIENSPNTLGEAMLLGVPCIVADVGGVRDLARDNKDVLMYPHDEEYMIPYYIEKIFHNIELAESLSRSAKEHARITHNKKINNERLISIYSELVNPDIIMRGSVNEL